MNNVTIRFKRGLQAFIDVFIPDKNELVISIDTKRIFIGDMVTPSGEDILVGNSSNPNNFVYYGSNKNGIRGFHSLPFSTIITPDLINGGDIVSSCFNSSFSIPGLKLEDSEISFIINRLPSWDRNKDIRLKLNYLTTNKCDNNFLRLNTKIKYSNDNIKNFQEVIEINEYHIIKSVVLSNTVFKFNNNDFVEVYLKKNKLNQFDEEFLLLNIELYQPVNGTENAYFMGGGDLKNTVYINTIDKLNFPFDNSFTYKINELSCEKKSGAGCNSSTHGYFMGGINSLNISKDIETLNFSFDSGKTKKTGCLTTPIFNNAGFNSSSFGYSVGGQYGTLDTPIYYDKIERISFSTDSQYSITDSSIKEKKAKINAVNSSSCGYIIGGYNNVYTNNVFKSIEKILFPINSGNSSLIGEVSITNMDNRDIGIHSSQCCNSSQYGYMISGYKINNVNKINFNNPTEVCASSELSSDDYYKVNGSGCNSSNYGFGSYGYMRTTFISIIDKINFSFDSAKSIKESNISSSVGCVTACDGTDFVTLFV